MTAEAFAGLVEARCTGPGKWVPAQEREQEPEPLISQDATWPTLPEPALHGLAGDVVRAFEPNSEADPAAILMQFLVAAGNLIGPGPHCRVESSQHGFNLFCLLIGETSKARKGTSWEHIRRLFDRVDGEWADNRVTTGLSSSEGLINEVRDAPDGETSPDRRLLIVQGEFASVLKIMGREGNTLSPTLRDAWDSGKLRTLVKHNPLKATGAHISMIGHVTRPELLKYLNETESHNGFANRLLFVCVRRSKCLPEGGTMSGEVMVELSRSIFGVVEWARSGPRELRRDDATRQLWAAVYPKLSAGLPGLLGAATARAEAQVLRLSGIYAVLDQAETVRVEHLTAALALWDYCFASARFIFGNATGDAVADRIRDALEGAGAEGLSRTGIRDLFKRHELSNRIEQALALLKTLGTAASRMVITEGRSIEVWSIATEATKATEGRTQGLLSHMSLMSQHGKGGH